MFSFIKFSIKFLFYFLLSYLILCIPFGDRPLFYHIHTSLTPRVVEFLSEESSNMLGEEEASRKPAQWIKKFFSNTLPGKEEKTENAPLRRPSQEDTSKKNMESYTVEERQFLEKILEKEQ